MKGLLRDLDVASSVEGVHASIEHKKYYEADPHLGYELRPNPVGHFHQAIVAETIPWATGTTQPPETVRTPAGSSS